MSELFGLSESTVIKITAVFKKFNGIDRVVVYGSRAKGNFRPGSDIDLTIVGPSLTSTDLSRIAAALDELDLPYKIDLSLKHQIENPDLIDHIDRIGQTLNI